MKRRTFACTKSETSEVINCHQHDEPEQDATLSWGKWHLRLSKQSQEQIKMTAGVKLLLEHRVL